MNYYHITADIDDDDDNDDDDLQPISSLRSEADGDEPNWLIISPRSEQQQPLQPPQPPSEPQPPVPETPPVKVRLRPKQKNVSHRISLSQRLSQFWWNHTAGEAVGEAAGEAAGEVAGEAASSCSVDANANAENDQDLPSSTKVNNEDPAVAQKITELFGSLQNGNGLEEASEAVQAVKSVEQPPLAQPRRRPRRSNPLRQQRLRHLNTVSGYFNDWTQWMTKTEANALNG